MSIPVPLRRDFDAPGLRRLARSSKDANQARRLLALATVYAGGTRTQAAEMGGVGVKTHPALTPSAAERMPLINLAYRVFQGGHLSREA